MEILKKIFIFIRIEKIDKRISVVQDTQGKDIRFFIRDTLTFTVVTKKFAIELQLILIDYKENTSDVQIYIILYIYYNNMKNM